MQMMQMFQQVMKAPNKMQMLRNLVANNPQMNNILNQLEAMTPEQRINKLDEMCKQFGISKEQINQFLRYK